MRLNEHWRGLAVIIWNESNVLLTDNQFYMVQVTMVLRVSSLVVGLPRRILRDPVRTVYRAGLTAN